MPGTVTEQGYVDSIATRTKDQPRERAELADRVFDAVTALEDTVADIGNRVMVRLEGWDDAREQQRAPLPDALPRYRRAAKEFEDAVAAAAAFEGLD